MSYSSEPERRANRFTAIQAGSLLVIAALIGLTAASLLGGGSSRSHAYRSAHRVAGGRLAAPENSSQSQLATAAATPATLPSSPPASSSSDVSSAGAVTPAGGAASVVPATSPSGTGLAATQTASGAVSPSTTSTAPTVPLNGRQPGGTPAATGAGVAISPRTVSPRAAAADTATASQPVNAAGSPQLAFAVTRSSTPSGSDQQGSTTVSTGSTPACTSSATTPSSLATPSSVDSQALTAQIAPGVGDEPTGTYTGQYLVSGNMTIQQTTGAAPPNGWVLGPVGDFVPAGEAGAVAVQEDLGIGGWPNKPVLTDPATGLPVLPSYTPWSPCMGTANPNDLSAVSTN